MKTILIVTFFFFLQFSLFAQTIGGNLENFPREMDPRDTLDYAFLNVHYRQSVRENKLIPDKLTESDMVLQIGNEKSKYVNYKILISDSIMAEELKQLELSMLQVLNGALMRTKKAGDRSELIKNYPKGQYWVRMPVLLDRYVYTETKPTFDWTFASDTLTVLGYLCKKATCSFRGRYYTA